MHLNFYVLCTGFIQIQSDSEIQSQGLLVEILITFILKIHL